MIFFRSFQVFHFSLNSSYFGFSLDQGVLLSDEKLNTLVEPLSEQFVKV